MKKEEYENFEDHFEVCECMGVTLLQIKEAIKDGCKTVEDIMEKTDAGTACQRCQSLTEDTDGAKELHIDEILQFEK